MPPTKKRSSRKAKTFLEQDTYTAELTSVQLVSGVCILLIFGLFCFLGGILVGKFEGGPRIQSAERAPIQASLPNLIPDQLEDQPEKPSLRQTETVPAPATRTRQVTHDLEKSRPAPEGRQTSPRTVELPAPPSKRNPTPPREVVVPPSTRNTSNSPQPTATSPTSPEPEAKQAAEKGSPSGPKGAYTVQIAAYGDRRLAGEMKKKVENGSAFEVELFDPGSGKYVIVYVGRFADRATAVAARDELRKAFGIADCFVKKLSS